MGPGVGDCVVPQEVIFHRAGHGNPAGAELTIRLRLLPAAPAPQGQPPPAAASSGPASCILGPRELVTNDNAVLGPEARPRDRLKSSRSLVKRKVGDLKVRIGKVGSLNTAERRSPPQPSVNPHHRFPNDVFSAFQFPFFSYIHPIFVVFCMC